MNVDYIWYVVAVYFDAISR